MRQREEGLGGRGLRQHLAGAIHDGPALGPEGDGLGVLALREPGVFVVLDHLEIAQPDEDPEEGTGDERGKDQRPAPQARRPDGRHGGGVASPRFMLVRAGMVVGDGGGGPLDGRGGARAARHELAGKLHLLLGRRDHAEARASFPSMRASDWRLAFSTRSRRFISSAWVRAERRASSR